MAARVVGMYPGAFLASLPSNDTPVGGGAETTGGGGGGESGVVEALCWKLVAVGRYEKVSTVLTRLRRAWNDAHKDGKLSTPTTPATSAGSSTTMALRQRAYLSDLGYRLALVMSHPRINTPSNRYARRSPLFLVNITVL